jgi:hypothetical protein
LTGLGKELTAAGWRQGSLLPALPLLYHYHIDRPLTEPAKQAQAQSQRLLAERKEADDNPIPVGQVIVSLNDGEVLCVVSQTCDIEADEEIEPFVEVVPAYREPNHQKRRNADRNSARRFLLCPERELVIDATRRFMVEKAVLTEYAADNPPLGKIRDGRLRRFLARRGGRPALDNDVVEYVVRPIANGFNRYKRHRPALDPVAGLRMDHLTGRPPYNVALTLLLSRSITVEEDLALQEMVDAIDKWLRQEGHAHVEGWVAIPEGDITLSAYRATDEVHLDYYTYQGDELAGEEPVDDW